MARPKTTGNTCRQCGATEREGATISTRRLCSTCNEINQRAALLQIAHGEGPAYERWVAGGLSAYLERAQALG